MTTVIFILQMVALAGLIVYGVLLIINTGDRKKQQATKSEPPQWKTKHPRRCKRRPKGQTGRKHPKGKRRKKGHEKAEL